MSTARATDEVAETLLANTRGGGSRRRARFHTLEVSGVRRLTDDAVEVTFLVPPELDDEYAFLPGQHVALRAHLDGDELRRSYSLCRPPTPGSISVAIKRDVGGRFSTWAQTGLQPGAHIDVMSPQGSFTSSLADLDGARVAGIAAGSGITPIMALATAVLGRSTSSRFTLVYANRSSADVMFLDDLADLKDRYPTRLAVHHVFSREERAAPLLSGRLDDERIRGIFSHVVLPDTVDEWFLCGPLELVDRCRTALTDAGVPRDRVRFELFTTGVEGSSASAVAPPPRPRADEPVHRIDLRLDGQSASVASPVHARETVLAAALRVRPDAPYSCSGGVCGTCRARLVDGAVTMDENYALEPDEIAAGYILTCQSRPTTERVVVDYDV
ncbi:ring-1,2-phenylacetyl-CoA epoxidase subunit PaaE [Microbacterium sp. SLBN-154]|uniref:1,2-phenylacetyl-CoA epoxidase subunit PaaE n=1 Tax=Microbacterium sp. SLBN-154 TaxID=2768458 RepID=UPI001170D73E|nr:1,2-phenylacetyl-CoA epoxidase subunit PaaE [Microbacterium sp. SLBN-154]TQK17549.1 ring-1,2-phenylacetyl-CoA epoxidase subunit PaaE [Microbacterium sp. SLBN-154]